MLTNTEIKTLHTLLNKLRLGATDKAKNDRPPGRHENTRAEAVEVFARNAEELVMAVCREVCNYDGTDELPYTHEVYVGWGLDPAGHANTVRFNSVTGAWELFLWNGIATCTSNLAPDAARNNVEVRIEW